MYVGVAGIQSGSLRSFRGVKGGISNWVVPEPKGFSDPVKKSAAHMERKWEFTSAAFGAVAAGAGGGAAMGVVFPIVVPVLAAGAAIGVFAKLRAKWLKEDPPRYDYDAPALLKASRFRPLVLVDGDVRIPPGFFQHLALQESCGLYLEVTVEAMEKALGAAEDRSDGATKLDGVVESHVEEARTYALATANVLGAYGRMGHRMESELEAFLGNFPDVRVESTGSDLWDSLSSDHLGALLAAGIQIDWLKTPLTNADYEDPELSPPGIAKSIRDSRNAAFRFADTLSSWAEGESSADA
jgi:hypothetical protein